MAVIKSGASTDQLTVDAVSKAARVTLYDSAGNEFVLSPGYTEGDVDTSIVGTAAMMEVADDTLQPIQGTVADGLLVNLGSNNDVAATGLVSDEPLSLEQSAYQALSLTTDGRLRVEATFENRASVWQGVFSDPWPEGKLIPRPTRADGRVVRFNSGAW